MNTALQDLSPSTVALAYDANHIAERMLFSRLPQAELHNDLGLLWYATGSDADSFNGVLQTQLEPDRLSPAISRVCKYFQQRHLPFLWFVGPSSRPDNLGRILEENGFTHAETEPVMAVDLLRMNTDLPVSSRLAIHRVRTHEQLLQWLRVCFSECPEELIQQCFTLYSGLHLDHLSPLRLYLGTIDGEPVATSLLFCGVEAASLRNIFTLPRYRGQGVGAMMTLAALHEARSCGYRIGLLAASPMGSALYRRIGFQAYGTFSVYYVTI
ncbi:GNAT family N-acetyltransferase [Dictyobacter formicarum]|uniref:GNAT family acetyltransferase n=1 Tax=Dictyobacter formicarum TaxID=2778368 RepID=A0ABQ3VJQ1_9CHLR|nr:GNAT family N-acetyltransferase [Dictyobacter formicarum]GHO86450.1 GNAT family acetyltransferase [Dictyobacter formicarum]